MRKQANSVTKRLAMYGRSVSSDGAGSYPPELETRVDPSTTKKKNLGPHRAEALEGGGSV